jgi:hypothetical protein
LSEATLTETPIGIRLARHVVGTLFALALLSPSLYLWSPSELPGFVAASFALVWGAAAVLSGLWWLFFTRRSKGRVIRNAIALAWALTLVLLLGYWQPTQYGTAVGYLLLAVMVVGGAAYTALKVLPKEKD